MTPLQFEESHQQEWDELQTLLTRLHKSMRGRAADGERIPGASREGSRTADCKDISSRCVPG